MHMGVNFSSVLPVPRADFLCSWTVLTNRRFRYFNFCNILIMKNKGTPPFRYVRNYFKRFSQVLWLFD